MSGGPGKVRLTPSQNQPPHRQHLVLLPRPPGLPHPLVHRSCQGGRSAGVIPRPLSGSQAPPSSMTSVSLRHPDTHLWARARLAAPVLKGLPRQRKIKTEGLPALGTALHVGWGWHQSTPVLALPRPWVPLLSALSIHLQPRMPTLVSAARASALSSKWPQRGHRLSRLPAVQHVPKRGPGLSHLCKPLPVPLSRESTFKWLRL